MTTENSHKQQTHSSTESKLKHGVAGMLKEIFKSIQENNLNDLTRLLENSDLADKSLNITLSKAFEAYKSNSKESKDIINVLLQ